MRGTSLRALNVAFAVAVAVALVAIPVYVVVATAQFTLRSVFDLGAIVPVARDSGFGRDFLDLELVFALFAVAAGAALFVDRPEREQRSVVELLALPAALAAGVAALLLPALAGHAGQKSPRGLSLPLDVFHLGAVAVWLGGLIGLVVLWLSVSRAGRSAVLAYVVPRFSAVAFCSVLLLIGTGTGQALLELPTLASLWQTSYGQALLWKIGLLAAALVLAGVNLARTKPRLQAGDASAPLLLRRLVQGEIVFVVAALFAAAVLSSLAPPSSALAKVQNVAAHVGPGPVTATVAKSPYKVRVRVTPNRAAVPNAFSLDADAQRQAGSGRRGDHEVRHARHGDGRAELPVARAAARRLLEVGARARDGRALGPPVRGHPAGRQAVRGHAAGQGERMRARLLIALVAVAAAAAAWVIALDALRKTL